MKARENKLHFICAISDLLILNATILFNAILHIKFCFRKRIDMLNSYLVNTPNFLQHQGVMIYIRANTTRAFISTIGTAGSISISVIGALMLMTSL
jgi:hypothetical protein